MFLKTKKRISELMDTISEMLGVLCQWQEPISAVLDCLLAVEMILSKLDEEEEVPQKIIDKLQIIHTSFYSFSNDCTIINGSSVKILNSQVLLLKILFQKEIKTKLNVVFFPYKASMWDSLATIYEATIKDEDCVACVVPIPYYQIAQGKAIPTYEGERFPENLSITHYSKYDLEEEQPDIIFVHNIYDQYNMITRVYEQYFTSNLKRYTDMLVYVPYHISSFITPQKGCRLLAYDVPTIKNVDKIILAGEFLKKAAIRDGIPEQKILALGSPKIDALINAMREDIPYPVGWKEKLQGKTVYVLNTGCLFFADDPFAKVGALWNFFNITNIDDNNVLIWRPHPLTKVSIMNYTPQLLNYYTTLTEEYLKSGAITLNNIILDETDDYFPALKAADVFISADGSLLRSYLLTEKKILFLDKEMPKYSSIPSNAFYYFYNEDQPWYKLVKKFSSGYDPLAKNRQGMAKKVYANTDGSCGEKVYRAIKEYVLMKS